MRDAVLALLVVAAAAAAPAFRGETPVPPSYASAYEANLTVSLPYASIVETMRVWFDAVNQRQRMEYYGGMDTTILDTSSQMTWEIVPEVATLTCFAIHGSPSLTSVLPDLTNFTYAGQTDIDGRVVDNWRYVVDMYGRTNTYNFYT